MRLVFKRFSITLLRTNVFPPGVTLSSLQLPAAYDGIRLLTKRYQGALAALFRPPITTNLHTTPSISRRRLATQQLCSGKASAPYDRRVRTGCFCDCEWRHHQLLLARHRQCLPHRQLLRNCSNSGGTQAKAASVHLQAAARTGLLLPLLPDPPWLCKRLPRHTAANSASGDDLNLYTWSQCKKKA